MAGAVVERELVYGLMALQAGAVGRGDLIDALTGWSGEASWPSGNDPSRPARPEPPAAGGARRPVPRLPGGPPGRSRLRPGRLDRQGVLHELTDRESDGPLRAWLTSLGGGRWGRGGGDESTGVATLTGDCADPRRRHRLVDDRPHRRGEHGGRFPRRHGS